MAKKVALISAATKGLGLNIARLCAERGYFVLGSYKNDTVNAQSIEQEFKTHGWTGKFVEASRFIELAQEPFIAGAEELLLVNNAGPSFEPKPLHLITGSEFQEIWSGAMMAAVEITRVLLPLMIKKKQGTIVNVASIAAQNPPPGFAAYASAKSALLSYTKSLACEYSAKGVRVFSVSPGFMLSPSTERWHPSLREAISQKQGGNLDPAMVAERVLQLVEDKGVLAQGEDYSIA